MKKLLERINREMEREAKRKGVFFQGNKNITIELELNDNEMCKFHGLNLGNNYHFGIKRNTVIITTALLYFLRNNRYSVFNFICGLLCHLYFSIEL